MTEDKAEFKMRRPMIAKLNFTAWRRLRRDLYNSLNQEVETCPVQAKE